MVYNLNWRVSEKDMTQLSSPAPCPNISSRLFDRPQSATPAHPPGRVLERGTLEALGLVVRCHRCLFFNGRQMRALTKNQVLTYPRGYTEYKTLSAGSL